MKLSGIFAATALSLIMGVTQAHAVTKVCIRKSSGAIELHSNSCRSGYSTASVSRITQALSDTVSAGFVTLSNAINTLSAHISTVSTQLSSLTSEVNGRFDYIPSGKTLSGIIGYRAYAPSGGELFSAYASFPVPVNAVLSDFDVSINGQLTHNACNGFNCLTLDENGSGMGQCYGTLDAPFAPPGKVCLYVISLSSDTLAHNSVRALPVRGASGYTNGIELQFKNDSAGELNLQAMWIYTAP